MFACVCFPALTNERPILTIPVNEDSQCLDYSLEIPFLTKKKKTRVSWGNG